MRAPPRLTALLALAAAAACTFERPPLFAEDALPADGAMIDAPWDGPDAPPQFSSCVDLAATCGPSGNVSCCSASRVPGGTFYRSYDAAPDDHNGTDYPATVSDFRLDTYEVTVGRFRQFVGAGLGTQASPPPIGAGAHPNLPGSGWNASWNPSLPPDRDALIAAITCDASNQTWTDTPGANESKPINCLSWFEAMAFCIWDGGYLPTEAEWNYAAAGGNQQRAFPWSSPPSSTTIDCTYANYSPGGTRCVSSGTHRVGSTSPKGDARWGHADMAGNVWEWVLDWYTAAYPTPCDDCAHLATTSTRVTRGGGFGTGSGAYLRTAHRDAAFTSTDRFWALGVRCARTP
jgi:formylglycine-generating enzyme